MKYEEPLLSVAVSMLCGIGLEQLSRMRVSTTKQVSALSLSFALVSLAIFLSRDVISKEALASRDILDLVIWTISLPAILLIILSLLMILLKSSDVVSKYGDRKAAFILSCCLLVILSCETLFGYIVPSYYIWNSLPTIASNPYVGAPFIDKLKQLAGQNRIFAKDAVLYPDWSSAFGLFDIRHLDAMYCPRYLPFVRSFFRLASPQPSGGGELLDRFTGNSVFSFSDYLQLRLLELSSTKYLVTLPNSSLGLSSVINGSLGSNRIIDDVVHRNESLGTSRQAKVNQAALNIGGVIKTSVGDRRPIGYRTI